MNINEFSLVIAEYQHSMRTYALKFTQDIDDADDLMQDTMIKAIRYFDQFEKGTNLKGWLFTIMRNTFTNSYRKVQKDRDLVITAESITYENLAYSATANQGENELLMGDIKGALAQIPVHLSTPFIRYIEGYRYQEIADQLKIPLGTVKTHIPLARKILSEKLKIYKERIN
jgi:RNA polymerase sigma factor (sigma-70 family)